MSRGIRLSVLFYLAWQLGAQGLTQSKLDHPQPDSWPTYNGDYSGRRFSPLKQIDSANVRDLKLAWQFQADLGGNLNFAAQIKSTPLVVDGILYITMPDEAWGIDARTGKQIWHYKWQSGGGIHIGNRGVGIYGNWLFFETPDNHLISLDKNTGKLRWSVEIADVAQQYFSTAAPLIVRNHVLVGVGGDSLDVPGFLEARDPETGKLQWRWNSEPKPGEPGSETWPDQDSMRHGGGMTWITGTYDADLNLLYWGTGNPNPVHAAKGRMGANLWTCSIVALNPETGKLAWYFQVSPHDTHDFDNVETPVLFDGEVNGQKRKLLAQAARNGYFVVLDRTNGKNVLTKPFIDLNWSKSVNADGVPVRDAEKDPKPDGTLVSPSSGGATNWFAPSLDPQTGLFYVNTTPSYSVYYLTDMTDKPQGYGGRDAGVWSHPVLKAIDYKTGEIRWTHNYPGDGSYNTPGILTTAGGLLFSGDPSNNFIAFDPQTGKPLWHYAMSSGGGLSNGPCTFELDGKQYVVAASGDTVYSFALPERVAAGLK